MNLEQVGLIASKTTRELLIRLTVKDNRENNIPNRIKAAITRTRNKGSQNEERKKEKILTRPHCRGGN